MKSAYNEDYYRYRHIEDCRKFVVSGTPNTSSTRGCFSIELGVWNPPINQLLYSMQQVRLLSSGLSWYSSSHLSSNSMISRISDSGNQHRHTWSGNPHHRKRWLPLSGSEWGLGEKMGHSKIFRTHQTDSCFIGMRTKLATSICSSICWGTGLAVFLRGLADGPGHFL